MRSINTLPRSVPPRVLLDHQLCIVRANRSMCRSFGVLGDNLIGSRTDDWINVDPMFLHRLRSKIRTGTMSCHVTLWLRLSGLQVLVVSQSLEPLHSRRAGYILISLAGIEVTERRQTALHCLQ